MLLAIIRRFEKLKATIVRSVLVVFVLRENNIVFHLELSCPYAIVPATVCCWVGPGSRGRVLVFVAAIT